MNPLQLLNTPLQWSCNSWIRRDCNRCPGFGRLVFNEMCWLVSILPIFSGLIQSIQSRYKLHASSTTGFLLSLRRCSYRHSSSRPPSTSIRSFYSVIIYAQTYLITYTINIHFRHLSSNNFVHNHTTVHSHSTGVPLGAAPVFAVQSESSGYPM